MSKELVVVDGGWVLLGEVTDVSGGVVVTDTSVVRVWGTTAGLGELALKGPTASTILDFTGEVRVNTGRILMRIPCKYK